MSTWPSSGGRSSMRARPAPVRAAVWTTACATAGRFSRREVTVIGSCGLRPGRGHWSAAAIGEAPVNRRLRGLRGLRFGGCGAGRGGRSGVAAARTAVARCVCARLAGGPPVAAPDPAQRAVRSLGRGGRRGDLRLDLRPAGLRRDDLRRIGGGWRRPGGGAVGCVATGLLVLTAVPAPRQPAPAGGRQGDRGHQPGRLR